MGDTGAFGAKQMLDWVLGGATPTQPASRLAALSLGTPTSVSGSEVGANSGYARQTTLFGAAASPAGSASNTAAMTFGPFSSSAAIQGVVIYDTPALGAGNIWFGGTLLTARTVLPGDTIVVTPGSLIVVLT
jgi:hypothetical protein